VLIDYYSYVVRGNVFGVLVLFYGFLILLIKRDKLSTLEEAHPISRVMGLILMFSSFFVYYGVALFYPSALFYGAANYIVYIVGLFLVFFRFYALKESLTVLILILGATASPFVGKWLEAYLEPWIPYFVQIMGGVLWVLGIPAKIAAQTSFVIQMANGQNFTVGVVAGCIGIYSFLTFAVIIVVTMMEDPIGFRTKLLWSIGGIIGTFFVNIIRVSFIFVIIYYFGFANWAEIHSYIGYVLFIAWLLIFFFTFSKRQVIVEKFRAIWQRIR